MRTRDQVRGGSARSPELVLLGGRGPAGGTGSDSDSRLRVAGALTCLSTYSVLGSEGTVGLRMVPSSWVRDLDQERRSSYNYKNSS